MKLGLCCLFKDSKITFKSCTLKKYDSLTLQDKLKFLDEIWLHNSKVLVNYISKVVELDIQAYRITSKLFPLYGINFKLDEVPSHISIKNNLIAARLIAERNNIKLSMHPDQFCVLNSPNNKVVKNSIAILNYHNLIAEIMNIDTITIHVGGAYNDKVTSINRFKSVFRLLNKSIQGRLTVENDDKSYNVEDLISISELNIPITYDVHHHRCNGDNLSIEDATELCIATWGSRTPHFHISSKLNGSKIRSHNDFIDINDFPECWRDKDIIIDVEAKHKELAIAKLRSEL